MGMADERRAEPTLLSNELLEELEGHWRRQQAPVLERLLPGLTDEEMDESTRPIGLRLPAEARVWWGWHDGATPVSPPALRELGPAKAFMQLREAIAYYRMMRDVALETVSEATAGEPERGLADPDYYWHPSWFPITVPTWTIACDCSVPDNAPTPIRSVSHAGDPEGFMEPKAQSLGELVSLWVRALETGAWHYNPERVGWDANPELLDFPAEQSALL